MTPEVGINNMIAVGHSKSYQTISTMDLQDCSKMGETSFCKGRNILLADLTKTGIWSLYITNAKAQKKIFHLDNNTYMVYYLRKISTNHVCPKAKTISAVQITSGQTVRINPSCYIRTMDHIITADDNEEIEIHSKWLDWTWTLGQLFCQPENHIVTAAIEKLRTKISRKFDAEVQLHKLEAMIKDKVTNHCTFTTPGAMIRGAIISLFFLFCCWKACYRSGPAPAPYPTPTAPSAPLAPLTIFNKMVDPIQRWRSRIFYSVL
jgi:hypothetical protein